MPSDATRAKSYVLRLDHLFRLGQEHSRKIIEAADEIRERVDSRWAVDASGTTTAALHDAASRIGLNPDDLRDLVALLWNHERRS